MPIQMLHGGAEAGVFMEVEGRDQGSGPGMSRRVKALPTRLSPCDELILIAEFCVGFALFVVERRFSLGPSWGSGEGRTKWTSFRLMIFDC